MHLRVDDAGQDMEPAAIHGLRRVHGRKAADRRNPAMPHADIAPPRPVLIDDGCTLQQQVELHLILSVPPGVSFRARLAVPTGLT